MAGVSMNMKLEIIHSRNNSTVLAKLHVELIFSFYFTPVFRYASSNKWSWNVKVKSIRRIEICSILAQLWAPLPARFAADVAVALMVRVRNMGRMLHASHRMMTWHDASKWLPVCKHLNATWSCCMYLRICQWMIREIFSRWENWCEQQICVNNMSSDQAPNKHQLTVIHNLIWIDVWHIRIISQSPSPIWIAGPININEI